MRVPSPTAALLNFFSSSPSSSTALLTSSVLLPLSYSALSTSSASTYTYLFLLHKKFNLFLLIMLPLLY